MDSSKKNVFSHYSDSLPSGSGFSSKEVAECSSASDRGTGAHPAAICSDDELLLASRNPKKRGGRKKVKETRHPVYRGVRWRNAHTWVCEVREPNKKSRIWLGTFPTAEMAARAHDVAAIALRNRMACVNFADSVWRLPVPASLDPKDIQKAAAEAAEMFRPPLLEEKKDVPGDVAQPEEDATLITTATTTATETATETTMPENLLFMDDEAIFGMPGLLANMAEGLMLPPPPPHSEGGDWYEGDDAELGDDAATEAGETFRPSLAYVKVSGDVTKPEDIPEKMFYMDEEAVFGMLRLLANMAKGLMLLAGGDWYEGDDVEFGAHKALWSFSI
ncbi:unnamed protein product [Camellia sinensis]